MRLAIGRVQIFMNMYIQMHVSITKEILHVSM